MFWKYGNMFCFLGKAKAHLLQIIFWNLHFVHIRMKFFSFYDIFSSIIYHLKKDEYNILYLETERPNGFFFW